eukprot:COSAG06_NODE_34201_length_478_cov_0.741425_1_plen_92_part_10
MPTLARTRAGGPGCIGSATPARQRMLLRLGVAALWALLCPLDSMAAEGPPPPPPENQCTHEAPATGYAVDTPTSRTVSGLGTVDCAAGYTES